MRQLTFEGYLSSYVQHLVGQNTLSLSKLTKLAKSEPRVVEPLLLWAAVSGHTNRLSRLLNGPQSLELELRTLAALNERGQLESALAEDDSSLRPEYTKVWRSYTVRRDASARDAQLKLKMRDRALELEAAKGVTRYRMAKDLGLNPGNLHAFLTQAKTSKLSLERAYELVNYLDAAA
ncbi:MAG: hypothetical protein LLG08_11160 [Actinomycetia bacterium]|nr:hypothetical protein [Actinomycetes bacterium]